MRVVRVILGFLAIVLAAPLLAGGTALVVAAEHRAPDGTLGAALSPVRTSGYAVVIPDIDELLRTDLPFARAGRTTVRIAVSDRLVPAFVGLAPRAAVAGYLAGVAHVEIVGVGVSGSALPVTLSTVDGDGPPPSLPGQQTFWTSASPKGLLRWSAGSIRGQHLALVLMGVDASAGVAISGRAAVKPGWLVPTAWAMVTLGALGVVASVVLLLRPLRRREVVYLVAPSQLPELTDRLGPRPEQTRPEQVTQPLATSEAPVQRAAQSQPPAPWPPASEPARWPAAQEPTQPVPAGRPGTEPASAGQFPVHPALAGQAASYQQAAVQQPTTSAGQPGQPPAWGGKPAADPFAAPPAAPAPGTPAPVGSGIPAQTTSGSGVLLPPPYRPASPGRVWASASVRAATLGEMLRAPTLVGAAVPAPVPPPVPAGAQEALVVPVWVYAQPQAEHRPAPVAVALGWPPARELTGTAPAQGACPDPARPQGDPAQPEHSDPDHPGPEHPWPQLASAQPEPSALARTRRELAQPANPRPESSRRRPEVAQSVHPEPAALERPPSERAEPAADAVQPEGPAPAGGSVERAAGERATGGGGAGQPPAGGPPRRRALPSQPAVPFE